MPRAAVPDIYLKQNTIFPRYSVTLDWSLLGDGTLDDRYALATSVCIALGTNALADINDPLPDPDSTDRQGWWGDLDCQEIWPGSWPIGSKLWLLRRSKIEGPNAQRGATIALVDNYIRAALQPFVDNRICSTFKVDSVRVSPQQIDSLITIYRGPEPNIQLRFHSLWDGIKPTGEPYTPFDN
jgi:phage gp46-like protein